MLKPVASFLSLIAFSLVVSVFCAHSTHAASNVSVTLDLDDPSTTANTFQTDFTLTAGLLTLTGSESVIYTDDTSGTGIRLELDVDFADRFAPVVNSLRFVGQLGDIDHTVEAPPIELNSPAVSINAVPSGIGSFLFTNSVDPLPVTGQSFQSGDTTLNVQEGEVVVSIPGNPDFNFDLSDANFQGSNSTIANTALSTILVEFDRTENGSDFYNVTLETPLEDAVIPFDIGVAQLEFIIDGTFRGTGSFSVAVPEPTTAGLAMMATIGLLGMKRRR